MILKYLDIELPLSEVPLTGRVTRFEWSQARYMHDFGMLQLMDWNIDPSAVVSGTPIKITATVETDRKTYYGYIHHTRHVKSSHNNYTEIYLIGDSYVMKQAEQSIYHNVTAADVVKKIAKKHGFAYDVAPHPRVYPQIVQAGESDWSLMVRLAKQSGYTLRSEGATLFFKPLAEDFDKYKNVANNYFAVPPDSVVKPRLYRIEPIIGESLEYGDAYKAAVAVSGVDTKTGVPFAVVNTRQPSGLRGQVLPEFFDRYDSQKTAPDLKTARYEAEAVDQLNRFPYRANALLFGSPSLRPDMPVYISNTDSQLDGYWNVLEVCHTMDSDNFSADVVLGTDTLGGKEVPPNNSGVALSTYTGRPTLTQTASSVKPTATIKFAKVRNRLSTSPVSTVSATWINSSGDIRGAVNSSAKVATTLGQ